MQQKRPSVASLAVALLMLLALQPVATAAPAVSASGRLPTLAPLVEKVSPAVVNIATTATVDVAQHPLMQHPFFRRFFEDEMPQQRRARSLGSGVIVNAEKGYILTNHHVIARADQIEVSLNDERTFKAKVVGSDPETDIAVIQIDAKNLTAVTMGDSSKLKAGDYVVALGNPFGLEHTVTSGIVSGLGRSLAGGPVSNVRIQDFIQTDASINPGNSGGALVNLKGELVGINTAILSRSGGNIGIGFAVPVNMAKTVMKQLIQYGEVRRGMLGVRVQDLTSDLASAMGMKGADGALIAQVEPGSPAAKAGLKTGDVVTAVDGKPVTDASGLARVIGLTKIGEEVTLTLVRDGEKRQVTATITEPEKSAEQAGTGPLDGVRLGEIPPSSPLHGRVDGVMVTAVAEGSPAAQYLQEGDVITSVNRQPVNSLAEFRAAAQSSDRLLLRVRRGDAALFVLVK